MVKYLLRLLSQENLPAIASKICPAGELQGLEVSDLVEIFRPAISKEVPYGTDLASIKDGLVGVRWQGRNLQVRVQDCRRALSFTVVPIVFNIGSSSPQLTSCETWQRYWNRSSSGLVP